MFCFICVYHLYQLTETIQLLAEDILERRQETTRLHRCLCKLAGKVTNVFFRLYKLQSTLCIPCEQSLLRSSQISREDASSFPTYLEKIEVTLLAGYSLQEGHLKDQH